MHHGLVTPEGRTDSDRERHGCPLHVIFTLARAQWLSTDPLARFAPCGAPQFLLLSRPVQSRDGPGQVARRRHRRRSRCATPTFMPVGTRAAVTYLAPAELTQMSAQILLANTYPLLLGPESLQRLGGSGAFMR